MCPRGEGCVRQPLENAALRFPDGVPQALFAPDLKVHQPNTPLFAS